VRCIPHLLPATIPPRYRTSAELASFSTEQDATLFGIRLQRLISIESNTCLPESVPPPSRYACAIVFKRFQPSPEKRWGALLTRCVVGQVAGQIVGGIIRDIAAAVYAGAVVVLDAVQSESRRKCRENHPMMARERRTGREKRGSARPERNSENRG
jgi:hypothetical protein